MGKNKNRDYSYYLNVSNLTEDEADNLSDACRRAKREYANNGRATGFTEKTKKLGRHIQSLNYNNDGED